MNYKIKNISFALSTACSANCIFCPPHRGDSNPVNMSFKVAKRVLDKLSSKAIINKFQYIGIGFGALGDDLLNPHFLDILRYRKEVLPKNPSCFFTNFKNLSSEIAEIIISEQLLDGIVCNIDGASNRTYYAVKRLDFEKVILNLTQFIKLRDSFNSNITININALTLNNYITTIKNNFGEYPLKLNNKSLIQIEDDFEDIQNLLFPIINPNLDSFRRSGVRGWAERGLMKKKKIKLNYKNYICPYFNDIISTIYVAPNGNWYACCLDTKFNLIIGDLTKESILDLYKSSKRKRLIRKLNLKQFGEIGPPCNSVNFCQVYYKNKFQTFLVNLSRQNEIINHMKNILLSSSSIRNIRSKIMDR